MVLNLYRRHTRTCTKGYAQGERIHRPTSKGERSKDCNCPISAEGPLKNGPIQNISTRQTAWDDAERVAKQWEEWGQPTPVETQATVVPTTAEAVKAFLDLKRTQVSESTFSAFEVFLLQRLLPFAQATNTFRISQFDDLNVVTTFVTGWINLVDKGKLKDSTRKAELERLRAFFRFCLARSWVKTNPAMSKDLAVKTKTPKKFGMEPDEEKRVFDAIMQIEDGKGNTGQANAVEMWTLCLAMRVAGLRIHDATTLNSSQLRPRMSGVGWAVHVFQKKTQEWVYIPITNDLYARLMALPVRAEVSGKRYWFWSGKGKIATAKNNWYRDIMKVVARVALDRPFQHPVTPHTFRHTFSIRHLNNGVDIKVVSRWLGHQSVAVTERSYAHAVRSTLVMSESLYDSSVHQQTAA